VASKDPTILAVIEEFADFIAEIQVKEPPSKRVNASYKSAAFARK